MIFKDVYSGLLRIEEDIRDVLMFQERLAQLTGLFFIK